MIAPSVVPTTAVLLDAGHFAVEEQPVPIAQHIVKFMMSLPAAAK